MSRDETPEEVLGQAEPLVGTPAVRRRAAVLVTGPWLAGSSSVAAALRERTGAEVIEADELHPGESADVVVFVVSAAAPLTESDCAVLDSAAAHTDAVVAVVSKTDLHKDWREVLRDNRSRLAEHEPRYAAVPWVGAAAAPDLGVARVDDLVRQVSALRADADLDRRNHLRSWHFRLDRALTRYDAEAVGSGREAHATTLRRARTEEARRSRVDRSERTIALRSQLQQARVQLSYFARSRCASVRTELQEDAAAMTRAALPGFAPYVRARVGDVVGEVDDGVTEHFADVAVELGLPVDSAAGPGAPRAPEVGDPPLRSHRVENRLMMLLGAGFGLGVALTLSRLFTEVAPGLAVAGAVLCVVFGVAVTVWVVRMRGLLRDRAVLDRWVGEVTVALRACVDQIVATRVLAAETSLTAALAAEAEGSTRRAEARVAEIDAQLRAHAMATAQAGAARDRAAPVLRRARAVVGAALAAGSPPARVRVDPEDWVDADVTVATPTAADLLASRVPASGGPDDPAAVVPVGVGAADEPGAPPVVDEPDPDLDPELDPEPEGEPEKGRPPTFRTAAHGEPN